MEFLANKNAGCCEPNSAYEICGCAGGVAYVQLTVVGGGTVQTAWLNTETGDTFTTKPDGFVTGACSDVPDNTRVCYTFGADTYSVFEVNGVKTIFKNDVLLTAAADVDAANAVIATATYQNIADCDPVELPDTSVCYAKEVDVPEVPGTSVFTPQSTFPTKRVLDGSGTRQERVLNLNYATGNEVDGQYSLRDGTNDHTGSNWAVAFNFRVGGTPAVPYVFYTQKLLGTGGEEFQAGFWSKDRAGNRARWAFRVLDGATVLATGDTGIMTSAWRKHLSTLFTMPASGEVTLELTNLVNGSSTGNDPLLDDVGLEQGTEGTQATTETILYRKVTLNGVDTYYDEDNNVVSGTELTDLLAEIEAGDYEVVACPTACACTGADLISADAGNTLTIGEDGKIYNRTVALFDDDQVLTGETGTNIELTLTPTVIQDPENSGVFQTNYAIKAEVKIDGVTIVEDPVTKELSAVPPEGCCVPAGGTDGQVLTKQPDGSFAWETPAEVGTTEVADGTTITGDGTTADPFAVANPVPTGGTEGQVLSVNPSGALAWTTPPAKTSPRFVAYTFSGGETEITLPSVPVGENEAGGTVDPGVGIVHVSRNGVDISHAWTWDGAVGTYDPALNLNCTIDAGNVLQFHWEAAV